MWLANAERPLTEDSHSGGFHDRGRTIIETCFSGGTVRKNLSYDPGFLALEGLIAGKPQTQFSAAEEPDCKAVRDAWLNDWIMHYVTADPNASEDVKSEYALADAKVTVEEVAGNPGYYTSKFFLRPHFRLEGLTVSLRLVTKLHSVKAGAS